MTAALSAGDLTINGTDVGGSSADGVSTANDTFSAIAIASAINSVEGETGVTATVNENTVTGGAIAGGTLNSTNNITINGVTFGDDADPVILAANDSDGALRDAINAVSNQTGVTASLDASNQLVLTAEDGRNIEVTAGGTGATITGMAAATTMGTITLTSPESIAIGGTSPADAGLSAGTTAVDVNSAVNSVSVLTQTAASSAITTIDAALKQVSSQRGSLGALTNRLESTIANLQTTAENLSSSESRIRDTDFASETAKLTRAQILQQAGTSILAQANVTSQAALTLLQ
jgi:flagellin